MSNSQDTTPLAAMDEFNKNMFNPQNAPPDAASIIDQKIKSLMETLMTVVNEVSKDKQISNKKMEELTSHFKVLGDIETGLSEQLDVMEQCLFSADFNACRPLNDHETEAYQELEKTIAINMVKTVNADAFKINMTSDSFEQPDGVLDNGDLSNNKLLQELYDKRAEMGLMPEHHTNPNFFESSEARRALQNKNERMEMLRERRRMQHALRSMENEGWELTQHEAELVDEQNQWSDDGADLDLIPDDVYDEDTRRLDRFIYAGTKKYNDAKQRHENADVFGPPRRNESEIAELYAEKMRLQKVLQKAVTYRNKLVQERAGKRPTEGAEDSVVVENVEGTNVERMEIEGEVESSQLPSASEPGNVSEIQMEVDEAYTHTEQIADVVSSETAVPSTSQQVPAPIFDKTATESSEHREVEMEPCSSTDLNPNVASSSDDAKKE